MRDWVLLFVYSDLLYDCVYMHTVFWIPATISVKVQVGIRYFHFHISVAILA